jgi:hypothetical protein
MSNQAACASLITMSMMASLTIFDQSKFNTAFANNTKSEYETVSSAAPTQPKLPLNISTPKMLRPLLEKMFIASPTFRRQCQEIERARHVKISIRLLRQHYNKGYRAISNVKRYEGGLLKIKMELLVPNDLVELIGHEFEHVIEQIEQVDLAAQVLNDVSDTSRNHDGSFETIRAVQAGRKVRMEFYNRERVTSIL